VLIELSCVHRKSLIITTRFYARGEWADGSIIIQRAAEKSSAAVLNLAKGALIFEAAPAIMCTLS
jgi:hypothetical protein